jgi:hypothetical protein
MPGADFETASAGILRRARVGVSLRDAAREEDAAERTVRGWLTRGRQNPNGRYGAFARALDRIRRDQNGPPLSEFLSELSEDCNEEDLLLCVERAVRAGSFQAIRLLLRMRPELRAGGRLRRNHRRCLNA